MTIDVPHPQTKPARKLDDVEVNEGLGSLVGLWEDGDEFADEVGRLLVERRTSRRRTIRDPGRIG